MLQLGQCQIGLLGDLLLDIGRNLGRHAAGRTGPMADTLGLPSLSPLAHHLARPSMAHSKIKRNRPQTVRATVIRGKKLPPQIVIKGSRHSFRVAGESPTRSLHYL